MPPSRAVPTGRGRPSTSDPRPAVTVGCGGLTVALTSANAAWLERARSRFAAFAGEGAPILTVAHGGDPVGRRQAFSHDTAGFDAWLDDEGHLAGLPAEAGIADLENLLRFLLPRLLADGLAFHAAVLGDGARGFLCVGECGAGKSTLAGLVGERALCDEIGVVRRAQAGFVAHSTPFWTGRSGQSPLAAVLVLRHGPVHAARRLAAATATGRLARHLLWPGDDPLAIQRAFALLADMTAQMPVFDFSFRPTPDVWDAITAAVA